MDISSLSFAMITRELETVSSNTLFLLFNIGEDRDIFRLTI